MTRPVDDRADAEHDAWLRAALRHAPDAELGAPPALSAAILREAGAARPTAVRRSTWRPLRDAWCWLARPPVAAGFASVMVATVVGLMWWDRPLEGALPPAADARVQAPTGAAPASVPDASVAVAPPPAVRAAAAPAPVEKARAAAPKPQARPPAVALRSEARAADAAAPAPTNGAAQRERADEAEAMAVAEPETARKMAAPDALADGAAPPMMEAARRAQATGALAAAAGLAAAPARLARPAASPSSFASSRADILGQPQRWTWQLDKGRAQTMTPGVQAWLARVDEVLAGATLAPSGPPEGKLLQLLHDGRPHTRLILGDTSLWLLPAEAGRTPLSVTLSPESAAALKAALDDALR